MEYMNSNVLEIKEKISLKIDEDLHLPLWRIRGGDGPTLVVTAGVHGCEYVGIEALLQLYNEINPANLTGEIIMLPLVNPEGFYAGAKQIVPSDGENLNRMFPGNVDGSVSQRIAFAIEKEIYPQANFLLDLHGGDINEALTPLVFFPVAVNEATAAKTQEAAQYLKVPYRLRSTANNGLYSYAAKLGIPSVLLEYGSGGSRTLEEINLCKSSIKNLMGYLGILAEKELNTKQLEAVESIYEDATVNGFWYPLVKAGQLVAEDTVLGQLKDIDGNVLQECVAKFQGTIWYYTTSFGVQKNDPLVAYGRF